MKKWFKRMMITLIIIVITLAAITYIYLQQAKFGRLPQGERLAKIELSSHYRDNQFQNLAPITVVTNTNKSKSSGLGFVFRDRSVINPPAPIPTVKTDLKALDPNKNTIIWLGHSSYLIHLEGKTILIDPVLSHDAAPIPWVNASFKGTDLYTPDELPEIDYLLISHDHWDHLDYPTVHALQNKVKQIIVGLGVGEHFERWNYDNKIIHELDWNQKVTDNDTNLTIHFLPAQHFSGRLFDRNKTLWGSFAIITPNHRLFFSGDSGYGPHFADIGKQFGSFDLVMLDMGQYDENWPSVHMNPEQASQAATDLNAKELLPGHIGKFSIAYHSWDDPFKRIYAASQQANYQLLSPKIGEPLDLDNKQQPFNPWWLELKAE